MENFSRTYPEFMKIVDLISKQNPLQKKRIHNFIFNQDMDYWRYAEEVCRILNQSFITNEQEQSEAARSFNRMSMDFLREQIRFSKTGVYSVDDANLVKQSVYSQPEVMRYYMVGLLLSYFLWPNHFQILSFFNTYLGQMPKIKNYLEIAPGHGLFTVEIMRRFPELKPTLLDISETSLRVTSQVLAAFGVDGSQYQVINGDFMTVPVDGHNFDFISMGEVLEHVNDPQKFLEQAACLLASRGAIFMSTCANCPAIDHVYHFHNVNEIRALIQSAGLSIVAEKSLVIEDVPPEGCYKELTPLNYCAILKKESDKTI